MSQIRWKFSWTGLESQREEIKKAAQRVTETDAAVRQKYPSSVATGLICTGIKTQSSEDPIVLEASKAQKELARLHETLVWNHHLDYDFVRLEWAPILDPNPAERRRCEALVIKNKYA